ncbi:MAG TPA: methyltransferase domain-containing protein [Terracidiphilus sp.]
MLKVVEDLQRWAGIFSRVPLKQAVTCLALNASHEWGISRTVRASHGHISEAGIEGAARIAIAMYRTIAPHVGDVRGKLGLEIGPGDNLGLAECFLAAGARRVVCAEEFATVRRSEELSRIIHETLGGSLAPPPELFLKLFESLVETERFDFIYSVDVFEHVDDPAVAAQCIAKLLNPGGVSVQNVDFRGHNAYAKTKLDFLTCPDWLWGCLHSSLQTTNRVRFGQLVKDFEDAGLNLESLTPLEEAGDAYVEALRPYLNPRFAGLPTADLRVLQAIITCRRPD